MPVVDEAGRLLGILARKDLIRVCGMVGVTRRAEPYA
jgi:CBS domain-containing protein